MKFNYLIIILLIIHNVILLYHINTVKINTIYQDLNVLMLYNYYYLIILYNIFLILHIYSCSNDIN